jgi:hypothetical protein
METGRERERRRRRRTPTHSPRDAYSCIKDYRTLIYQTLVLSDVTVECYNDFAG